MNDSTKFYYSISEVCEKTGLEPHVLRYWESEFSQLHPKKNRAGNRAYRDKDIQLIEQIKHLLYEEKFTIPGAIKRLAEDKTLPVDNEQASESTVGNENNGADQPLSMQTLKNELHAVLKLLKE